MTCLKRALKVANAAQQQLAMSAKRTGLSEPVRLYVDILNQYLFFFDQGVPNITVTVLQVRHLRTSTVHQSRCGTRLSPTHSLLSACPAAPELDGCRGPSPAPGVSVTELTVCCLEHSVARGRTRCSSVCMV